MRNSKITKPKKIFFKVKSHFKAFTDDEKLQYCEMLTLIEQTPSMQNCKIFFKLGPQSDCKTFIAKSYNWTDTKLEIPIK